MSREGGRKAMTQYTDPVRTWRTVIKKKQERLARSVNFERSVCISSKQLIAHYSHMIFPAILSAFIHGQNLPKFGVEVAKTMPTTYM